MKIGECLTNLFCCFCLPKPHKLRRSAGIEQKVNEIARSHIPKKSGHVWGVKDGLEE